MRVKHWCAAVVGACALTAAAPGPAWAAPANDNFANASFLGTSTTATITGSNVSATVEPGENTAGSTVSKTVWYRWTPPKAGNYRVAVCDSSFNTYVGVFTGTAVSTADLVASDDDAAGCGADGARSQVDFLASAGQEYRIQVGSHGAEGIISGSITLQSPPNDLFADATTLSGAPATFGGTNVGATVESGENTGGVAGRTVWYRWRAPQSATYRVSLCDSNINTYLGVFRGATVGTAELIANDDDFAGCGDGTRSQVDFAATGGQEYRLQIGSPQGASQGTIAGSITQLPAPAASPGAATPTTTPAPTATAPVVALARLTARRATVSRRGVVSLKLSCPATQTCAGTARLLSRKVTIGRAAYSIGAGGKQTLKIKLTTRGRTALRKAHGRLKVTAKLTPKGAATSATRAITLAAAR